jgi:hypothetical protein
VVAIGTVRSPGLFSVLGHSPAMFERVTGPAAGNDLPGITGDLGPRYGPGPGPQGRGYFQGGQLGQYDGTLGSDPRAPKIQPAPHVSVLGAQQENARGYGLEGFNDKLRAVDRHAFFDAGHQKTGITFNPATANPNTYNNPLEEPPRPDLRTVNRSVTHQIGSDATRNQDDLSRGYTWLGEQGSGWSRVWGGVPGLYQPYGTRGGVPYPIVSPVPEGTSGDGPQAIWAGLPHGLHSVTYPDRGDTLNRYKANQQMQPVRIDRPSNSPQAGQSYSQLVQHQGGQPTGTMSHPRGTSTLPGRGWLGTNKRMG